MEKIEKKQRKQEEVYSYVEDKFIKGFYSGETGGNRDFNPIITLLKAVMFTLIVLLIITGILVIIASEDKISNLISLLILIAFVFMIFGLLNPSLVLKGFRRTRWKVLKYYGLTIIVLGVLLGVNTPITTVPTAKENEKQILNVETKKSENITHYKSSAKSIPYIELARNIDKYKSKRVVYKGKVEYISSNSL
ncbi:hypothetical protein [Bacillus sp. JJ722]|uniref:hypothetical protein n=1 Tax=Bacillus sp. JJ722 TaxID=3122973 RepID=UPI002FFF5BD2